MYRISFIGVNDRTYTKDKLVFNTLVFDLDMSYISIYTDEGMRILLYETVSKRRYNSKISEKAVLNIDGTNILVDRINKSHAFIFIWDSEDLFAGCTLNDIQVPEKFLNFRSDESFKVSVQRLCKEGILPRKFINFCGKNATLAKFPSEVLKKNKLKGYKMNFTDNSTTTWTSTTEAMNDLSASIQVQQSIEVTPATEEELQAIGQLVSPTVRRYYQRMSDQERDDLEMAVGRYIDSNNMRDELIEYSPTRLTSTLRAIRTDEVRRLQRERTRTQRQEIEDHIREVSDGLPLEGRTTNND